MKYQKLRNFSLSQTFFANFSEILARAVSFSKNIKVTYDSAVMFEPINIYFNYRIKLCCGDSGACKDLHV